MATTSPLRQRMIEDMTIRNLSQATQQCYIYAIRKFSHDWDGVRSLTSADARLRVADCFDGLLRSSPYFSEYEANPENWTMEFGTLDREPVLLVLLQRGDQWEVAWPVRVHVNDGVIDRIEDYYACPWVIGNASASDLGLMTGQVIL
jgi:RNA polymerase sigma-70 factor, ECF subfamily